MKDDENSELLNLLKAEQESGRLSEEEGAAIQLFLAQGSPGDLSPHEREESQEGKSKEGDIRAQLRDMKLPQKMKLAMFGNSVCRSLLIFDANRLVQNAVLKNPQLQVTEVESFVKNNNCPEYVLRTVSASKSWMKGYVMKLNFVLNPKSPADLSLKWLSHLRHADLKRVAQSKNIPQVLANAAKKRVVDQAKEG